MFGIGTSELVVFGVLVAVVLLPRLPSALRRLRSTVAQLVDEFRLRQKQNREQPRRVDSIEFVTPSRDTFMKKQLKKFMWSPAFWAILGLVGCTTGFYFQGVAANGSGLWCLGLIFLGAAYLEQNP
jgi:Sec-independent protein translocase protein TatA